VEPAHAFAAEQHRLHHPCRIAKYNMDGCAYWERVDIE
jgi:hypothetical protein